MRASRQADGIGYVFAADDPFTGFDFDAVTPDALWAIERLQSYTEQSASGTGMHVIVRGALAGVTDRNRRDHFEVYDQARFFVVTGAHLPETPTTIEPRQAELHEVVAHFLPPRQQGGDERRPPVAPAEVSLSDGQLLERMFAAKNGAAVRRLWEGDTEGYPSASEADLALCGHLAFWTGGDRERMDALFRASGRMRDKWEREDYRTRTIERALTNTTQVYRASWERSEEDHMNQTEDPPDQGDMRRGDASSAPLSISIPFVDWADFWARDRSDPEWVYDDVLARGRGHAIYATHKQGKSLLALFMAARIATREKGVVVVYLDYEMGEDDLHERLEDMGYGPASDLRRLRYALLPTLPHLDTEAGGQALAGLLDQVGRDYPDHHQVVMIDTMGRAVAGEENSSDTFRAFYAHTGIKLKRRGCTWTRLDHGGKDPTRGQRGSSGKGDDVDLVWRLARTQDGVTLHRDAARMAWVPERVSFHLEQDPLRYTRIERDWPTGTMEVADTLDRLGVPLQAKARAAQAALKEAGEGRRKQVVVAALRWRRQQQENTP
ncbi:MAG: AAA family ATPase [Actinobacteria bacterium]|nr:AAA family ATPase [Actinomycetota bacterium]